MTTLNRAFLQDFADRYGPVGKALSMLVRTTFVAEKDKVFVWGDWAAIEARVLPWLAGSPGAEATLDIFRKSDADPSQPDVYVYNAARLLGREPMEMWAAFKAGEKWAKSGRQSHGKVPVLSLGFGGGFGALQAMAVNYKVHLDDVLAKAMVAGWRAENAWAPEFWGKHTRNESYGLWGAIHRALERPGDPQVAGRVAYVFDRSYLSGTLFCALPCGQTLTYPDIKVRTRQVVDKATGETSEKTALWYRKEYGWAALWHGKAAENITQATAGAILRETLVKLEEYDNFMPVVGHTHDEIVAEPSSNDCSFAAGVLYETMQDWRPDWRADLPLTAEVSSNWFYTKAIEH